MLEDQDMHYIFYVYGYYMYVCTCLLNKTISIYGLTWKIQKIMSAEEKVRELATTIKELSDEAQRLQSNLNRLHELQASLIIVSEQFLSWLERAGVSEKR